DIGGREDDELSQYGDEQDVPVRRQRSSKPAGKKKTTKKKPAAKKKKKRARKKRRSFFEWLFAGTPQRKRKRMGVFSLFGREIHLSFWPVFLIVVALLLIIMVFMQGNSLRVDEQNVTLVGLPQ